MDQTAYHGRKQISVSEAREILATVNHLRDAWGNGEYHYEMQGEKRVNILFHTIDDRWFDLRLK